MDAPILRPIGTTPVSYGTSREAAKRSDLAGHVAWGFGASHSRHLWNMRLNLLTTAERTPGVVVPGESKLDQREVLVAPVEVDLHLIADWQAILAERGIASPEFDNSRDPQIIHLAPPKRADAKIAAFRPRRFRSGSANSQLVWPP